MSEFELAPANKTQAGQIDNHACAPLAEIVLMVVT
jgi:hypothetical protein